MLTGAVKQRGPAKGSLNHTLMVICDEADDFGFACPSIESIAHGSRCSVRQAIRRIAELEEQGWLKVKRKVFRGSMANAYFVDLPKLGVKPNEKSRRSPLWQNFERLMRALESRDKVSLLNGVLKFEKTPQSVDIAASGNLFYDESASDILSLANEAETAPNGANLAPESPIAAKRAETGGSATAEEDSAGDKMSHVTCQPCHVTSDIEGEPFNVLTHYSPIETKAPPTPASGGVVSDLPFGDVTHNHPGFADEAGIAARWLMGECGLGLNSRLKSGLEAALTRRAKRTGHGLVAIATLAVKNFRDYHAALASGLLRFGPWKARTFFENPYWEDPGTWPWDQAKQAARGQAAVGVHVPAESVKSGRFSNEELAAFIDRNATALDEAGCDPRFGLRLGELAAAVGKMLLEDLDRELQAIEEEVVAELRDKVLNYELAALEAKADFELSRYKGRMNKDQLDQVRTQFVERELMKARGAPRLSLYYMVRT
jgi:hypothetical protein